MGKRIYLDYASLTPIDPRVQREMRKFSLAEFANPSSFYKEGVNARTAMEKSRKKTADFLHAHADEIVFTGGGTEANNLAMEGVVKAAKNNGIEKPHIIISSIEHSSIIECANKLERNGVEVTRLGVDSRGIISPEELKKAMKPNTVLISIMTVNNEIGAVQPIREIAKIIRNQSALFAPPVSPSFRSAQVGEMASAKQALENLILKYPLFHTDAAQAALHQELNVEKLGVDLLTLDGSKVYGPRGIGALYIKRGTPIEPIIYGGGQEKGLRAGTENVPAIVGFAEALELAKHDGEKESRRIAELKYIYSEGLQKIRPDVHINGDYLNQAPHILNVSIPGIDNEFFLFQLDAKGIAVSTKSSCLRDEDESYVLKAIGGDSKTSIRFSFGRWTRKRNLRKVLKSIRMILNK